MTSLLIGAICLQGLLVAFDEFYFHWRRNLPRWERLGHPLDSVSLLMPVGLLAFFNKTPLIESLYGILGILSCLCITKDEWIHRKYSEPGESWVHSLLFVLHPAVLLSGYFSWGSSPFVIKGFFFSILAFGIYQIIFWNFYADRILENG